ncbi:MAG: hypothetical protein AAGD11_00565 [Planctomycetota bacterium]
MNRLPFTLVTWCWLAHAAHADLVFTLREAPSDGVIGSVSGSGTFDNTSLGITNVFNVDDVGEFTDVGFFNFVFVTPLTFAPGITIGSVTIDDDGIGNDDFFWFINPPASNGLVPYSASGSSVLAGLSFSDLVPGTYSSPTHPQSVALGGFTLNIVAIPEPSAFLCFGLVGVLESCRRRSKRHSSTDSRIMSATGLSEA